ncbi:YdcF family protein [Microbacter sp. GSS18]|nr:YdcF family protein [Microbacter sp. GSS18]
MRRLPLLVLVGAAAAGAALLAWGEWGAWRASRAEYPPAASPGEGGEDVVLVLGYPPRADGRPSFLQRWRTRIAARSAPPGAVFVFSGAAVHGERAEADIMAEFGERLGLPADRIVRETRARSTRENIVNALPWLRAARTIRIASNTHHALRARRYLREADPDLVPRLVRTRDFVPLELGPFRLALTFYDWVAGSLADERAHDLDRPNVSD